MALRLDSLKGSSHSLNNQISVQIVLVGETLSRARHAGTCPRTREQFAEKPASGVQSDPPYPVRKKRCCGTWQEYHERSWRSPGENSGMILSVNA